MCGINAFYFDSFCRQKAWIPTSLSSETAFGCEADGARLQARQTYTSDQEHETLQQEINTFSEFNGYYKFSNLVEGGYLVAAVTQESRSVAKLFVQAGAEGADIVLPIVERTLHIQGWIENPLAEPVEGARVFVAGATLMLTWVYQNSGVRSRSLRITTTDLGGRFRFAQVWPGAHAINVDALHFEPLRVGYDVGTETEALELRLREAFQSQKFIANQAPAGAPPPSVIRRSDQATGAECRVIKQPRPLGTMQRSASTSP